MENLPKEETFYSQTMHEMEGKGYAFRGLEMCGRDKFDNETARFIPTVEQTANQIYEKYRGQGKFEVEMVLMPLSRVDEMVKSGLVTREEADEFEIPEAEREYMVFTKEITQNN